MCFRWKLWHRQPGDGTIGQDGLERLAVGDPDPTSGPGMANGSRRCQLEWADEASQSLILVWSCTRELGHQGQHLAGTGESVAAVLRKPMTPTGRRPS